MKPEQDLKFPVWNAPLPVPPPMTPEQYDRFLEETCRKNREEDRMKYLPVPEKFVLVKEDGARKYESSGTD